MKKLKLFLKKIFFPPCLKFKGKNNSFVSDDTCILQRLRINIWGDNNKIILGKNVRLHNTKINIGFSNAPVNDCIIEIGDNTSVNSIYMQMGESNSTIQIGKDCRFSYDIEINCTDHHSIFDVDGNLINQGKSVEIGENVWVCKEVRIQKNSKVPSGCVVGQGAIVAKKFDKQNCVIVGNPARIVKENVYWNRIRPETFIKENKIQNL